ncbi:hypothetical protein KP509_1Z270000 [Ceratopteris richardii]|nr:hypothetical protein KP509_1Z270000 [Ceratopteris richardii]
MKVQCDFCEKAQATVWCCADEASLCAECDSRVHAANKLAGKHQRVSLLYSGTEDLPYCDICQEKNGYFFCLEDRAVLCRNCDYSIHSKNALTGKHKRYLITGLRVGLQALASNEPSDNIHTLSTLHLTTQLSPLASSATQGSQLSSPRNIRPQKAPRVQGKPMTSTALAPQEASSAFMNGGKENASDHALLAPSVNGEQLQEQQNPVMTLSEHNLQCIPSSEMQLTRIVCPLSVSVCQSSSFSRQFDVNGGKQLPQWGMYTDTKGSIRDCSAQRAGGGSMRKSGVSEFWAESVPGVES